MMSVGYGDIHATTTAERTFSVVTQLVGVSMFGFLVASISSMLETLNVRTSLFQQKMDEVSQYLLSLNVPATLKTRVLSFYTYLYTHKSMFNEPVSAVPSYSMHQGVQLALTLLVWGLGCGGCYWRFAQDILAELSDSLRNDLLLHSRASIINNISMLQGQDPNVVSHLVSLQC